MLDPSHLERMGRELKCPICLSLFSRAVSLTCNHVFCNCCIEKSMKSAPYCPVCKVPFCRREIRPAPHMDNLVSIYKSMEVASGVNIFVTQVATPRKSGLMTSSAPLFGCVGTENHLDDEGICETQDSNKTCTSPSENHRKCEKKGSRKSAQVKRSNKSLNTVEPSFPAKKRVHVPQCPPSDLRPDELANETPRITNKEQESSLIINDKPVLSKKEEPLFTPFFWLRDEEDTDKTSQQSYGDQIFETLPNVPCFSDIKDSDDEVPSEMPPETGTCVAGGDDIFDSEMFEWTQRACSPELRSSPGRMVVHTEDGTECGGQENVIVGSMVEKRNISPSENIVEKSSKMSGKRTKKTAERRQSKRAKTITSGESRAPRDLINIPGANMQEKFGKSGDALNETERKSKSKKKVSFDADVTKTVGNVSSGANISVQGGNKTVVDLPGLPDDKKCKKRKNYKKVLKMRGKKSPMLKDGLNSKVQKTKASWALNHSDALISHLQGKPSSAEEVFNMERVLRRCEANYSKRIRNMKMSRLPDGNNDEIELVDDSSYHKFNGKDASKDAEKLGAAEENCNSRDKDKLSGVQVDNCSFGEKIPNRFCCAFCQSADESEASGVMVRYLNGKPVTSDQIEGPNVIYSHKNCTEWAPNVFFEDDFAINLDAELKRSRKIKCGLCGAKGAALGCLERSCRKSFHIPCAKMTPQFRWDYENFVVLCPLHAYSKLPFEGPASESNRKRSTKKRESHHQQKVAKADKENLPWKSKKKAKDFILCCSSLTNSEKEIVSEFEKLSWITVLKNWDSSVTHVVASTDNNGACKRTLKFLMGVLEGKWIVNMEWITVCIKSMELVDEQPYEIKVDVHGIKDGPNLGRLRYLQKKSKLFNGCKFHFMGDFEPSYKGYLHDLVMAAGGIVLNRKPVAKDHDSISTDCPAVLIVYSLHEQPRKGMASKRNSRLSRGYSDVETLAASTGAVAVTNLWLLNSIAGCKLQNLPDNISFPHLFLLG